MHRRWAYLWGILMLVSSGISAQISRPQYDLSCRTILRPDHNTILHLNIKPNIDYNLVYLDQATDDLLAEFDLEISARKPGSGQVVYERRVTERLRQGQMSEGNPFLRTYRFQLDPGKYQVWVEIRDRRTRRIFLDQLEVDVRAPNGKPLLSDLWVQTEKAFGPAVISRELYGSEINDAPDHLRYSAEVYSPAEEYLRVRSVLYRLERRTPGPDDQDRWQAGRYTAAAQKSTAVQVSGGKALLLGDFELRDLPPGVYLLEVLVFRDEQLVAEQSREFSLVWDRMKDIFANLDRSIDQMSYIASEAEIGRLKALPEGDAKPSGFLEFWQSRTAPTNPDPLQALQTYYGRVFFAEENFKEEKAGWKTDRAEVYVLYGPPDQQIYKQSMGMEFLIWTYSRWGLRFVFAREGDRHVRIAP